MGLKIPSKTDVDFIRNLFVGFLFLLSEEESAGECFLGESSLGASVVHYSIEESSLDRRDGGELLSGQDPGFTMAY